MYWRSNVDSSKIESLLDKENVTLCEILSEDAVINEVQVYNERLLNYLLIPDHLTEMLLILISTPEPSEDGVIYFKLPNVICEILSSYVSVIYTAISSSPEYMSLLFKPFIESDRKDGDTRPVPINSVTCSLIFKVAKVLCQQCSGKMLNFLKAVDQILDRFLDNIENNSVTDFLVKCIQLFPPGGAQIEFLDWLSKENVTWSVLSRLDVNSDPQVFSKSIQCLVELLLAVRGVKVTNALISDLESPKVVTHILSVMLGVPMNRSSMISSGLEFIKAIFELPEKQTVSCFSASSFQSLRKTNVKSYDVIDNPDVYNPIIQCLVLKLSDFKNILEDSSELKKIRIPTAYGGEIIGPLGPHRLALIDLIHHLVLLEQNLIYYGIINTGLIATLIDLFFEFHLNSFLHRFVTEIINKLIVYACEAKIVNDTRGKDDVICDKILQELFVNQKLLLKIISGWESNMTPVPGKNKMIRNTHRPFLRIIANTIEKYCTNFNEVVSPESLTTWKSFATSRLAEENRRNLSKNNDLTGYSSSDGDGATESVEDFDYEDALKVYDECVMQEMTKRFPDYQYKPLFLTEKNSLKNELNTNPLTDFFLSTQEDTENAECFETICNVMISTKMPFEDCVDEIEVCNDVELNSTQEEEVIDEIYTDNYGKPSTSPSVIIDSVFREAYKDQNQSSKLHEIKIFDNRMPLNQQINVNNNSRFYFTTGTGLPSVSKDKRLSETVNNEKLSNNVIIDSNIIPKLNFSGLSENNGRKKKEIIPSFGIFKHPRAMSDDKITEHGSPISMEEFDIDDEMPATSTTRYIYEDKISEFSDNSDEDDDIPLSSRFEKTCVKPSENLSQLDKILDDKTWNNPAEVSPVEETCLQFDTVQDVTPDLVLTHCNIISPERNDTPDLESEFETKDSCNDRSVIKRVSHIDDISDSPIVKIHIDNPFSPELTRHSSHINNQNSGVNKNQLFESSKCLTLTSINKHKISSSSKHTFSTIYSPLPWTSFQTVNRSTSMPVKISISNETSLGNQKSNVLEDPTSLINGLDSSNTCQTRSSN